MATAVRTWLLRRRRRRSGSMITFLGLPKQSTLNSEDVPTTSTRENGVNPELLLAGKYGHALHVWDLQKRRHQQTLDLGAEQQMVLELRPAHDPNETYGFVGVVVSLRDLSASIWLAVFRPM